MHKVGLDVKFRKDDKERDKGPEKKETMQESKPEEKMQGPVTKPVAKPEAKKNDAEKFDLITIVSSVEMDIPEKEPPYADILYDFIPESEQRVTANRDDHVSKKVE